MLPGHVGVVKDATETTARVELHSNCQTISVDKNRVSVVGGGPKAGSLSTYNKTPLQIQTRGFYCQPLRLLRHAQY